MIIPKVPCSGVNATDAADTRVRPGLSRRCRPFSYCEGSPYGFAATGIPKPVVCAGMFNMLGSPAPGAACAERPPEAIPTTAIEAAAEETEAARNFRRISSGLLTSSCARKFSGALIRRPDFFTSVGIQPSPVLNSFTTLIHAEILIPALTRKPSRHSYTNQAAEFGNRWIADFVKYRCPRAPARQNA